MNNDEMNERLSALADGQLDAEELAAALAFAVDDENGRATWQLYHLVGDALRSPDLARPADPAFMPRLRAQLAKEALAARPRTLVQAPLMAPARSAATSAANASVFRWKMLAGLASLAALGVIGWSALAPLQSGGFAGVPAQSQAAASAEPLVAVADTDGQQLMIRDPRLDELLAAHKQFGSMSAVQMPTGFLRNATFENPGR
ncbi:anti-anti-sigma factor [Verminephrobacter eiseniae]|uniref:sigma-E factor negative regulatory protein n=1 Tax=Verminephrobacter eiseniae TaxID=364317 RepID=UPI0022381F46|nr:sigma-E factor negative regulatory protein [Verminephrobacter eiseniae]MCW5259750.1 anti-anti-sigma factor [Verminephrobacter eiseniae]